jgi:hypothetical protein
MSVPPESARMLCFDAIAMPAPPDGETTSVL